MHDSLLIRPAALALLYLLSAQSGWSATRIAETNAAEAAIRQADADWAAAAGAGSVDGWMTFYTPDSMVMAPEVPLTNDPRLVRQTVTQLLALPHLSLSWHPVKVEVAASGDLAYLIGEYALRYDDALGRSVSDRGKLLEIWRKQPGGDWRCSVDTWNSDGPDTAAPVALQPGVDAVPSPRPGGSGISSEYGEMPTQYEAAIREYFHKYLKYPDSVRYREITRPERGSAASVTGTLLVRKTQLLGWIVKATIDAKNSRGAYVGFKTYSFLFRDEKIVHTTSPLPDDEMK